MVESSLTEPDLSAVLSAYVLINYCSQGSFTPFQCQMKMQYFIIPVFKLYLAKSDLSSNLITGHICVTTHVLFSQSRMIC